MSEEKKPQQVPSIGRVVHFVYGDQHCAAITTVALQDESGAPGTWHWPEFVPAR